MDELGPSARALLDAAGTSDDPSPDDAKRVRRAVLLQVGALGVGTSTLAANAKGVLGALGVKLGAALLIAAGASAVTYLAVRPSHEPPRAVVPARTPSVAPRAVEPVEPRGAPAPVEVDPAQDAESPAPPPVARARKVAPPDPEPSAAPQNLEAEMKLIRSADAALRGGRTSDALSLLAKHAKEHPKGLLSQERRGLEILARCQGGAGPRAQKAAEAFLSSAPRSPLSARVKSACSLEK